MEIVSIPETREVSYYGTIVEIPYLHFYIATDSDGKIYSYSQKPRMDIASWKPRTKVNTDFKLIEDVIGEFLNVDDYWRYTLRVYPRQR